MTKGFYEIASKTFQLFVKEYEESDWKPKASPNTEKEFLIEIAKERVYRSGFFSAKIVEIESDVEVYWI